MGLCLLFFPEFGVTGFPAVGDLGQELADVFYLFICPKIDGNASGRCSLGLWDLACGKIPAQCCSCNTKPFRDLLARKHSVLPLQIDLLLSTITLLRLECRNWIDD